VFVYFSAIGGCLFVRYLLEKRQTKIPPHVDVEDEDTEIEE
jgi:hypothetical protein